MRRDAPSKPAAGKSENPVPLKALSVFDFGYIQRLSSSCISSAEPSYFISRVPREGCSEPKYMHGFFKRQLADYVEYHRDPWNCAMHVMGIIALFFAAILPLSLWPVHAFGVQTTLAPIMVLPVLSYWLLLDTGLGAGILGAAILLLATSAFVAGHASVAVVWSMTAALIVIGIGFQVVGHRVFERRQPALVDNPSHLLLGPMFVMAKLFIALGFRRDLAAIIQTIPRGSAPFAEDHQVEPLPRS
jgi:uncharacterized membrane protein YGL010W